MKQITINGTTLYYQVMVGALDTNSDYVVTQFYEGFNLKPRWSFLGFKSKKMKETPFNKMFKLSFDIEDCNNSKEMVRNFIEPELKTYFKRKERCDQISRGEII